MLSHNYRANGNMTIVDHNHRASGDSLIPCCQTNNRSCGYKEANYSCLLNYFASRSLGLQLYSLYLNSDPLVEIHLAAHATEFGNSPRSATPLFSLVAEKNVLMADYSSLRSLGVCGNKLSNIHLNFADFVYESILDFVRSQGFELKRHQNSAFIHQRETFLPLCFLHFHGLSPEWQFRENRPGIENIYASDSLLAVYSDLSRWFSAFVTLTESCIWSLIQVQFWEKSHCEVTNLNLGSMVFDISIAQLMKIDTKQGS